MDRFKKSHKLFHHGEGFGMSHHQNDQLVHQPQVSQCSTMPTFLAMGNEGFQEQESLEEYFMEYEYQTQRFKYHLIFQGFCQIKDNRGPRHHHRGGGLTQNHDRHHTTGRLFLPNFDGSSKCTAKSWVEKLDIYFQLKKFLEMEAIKIAALHLEGEAHDRWFHDLSTLVHSNVTTYLEFTRRMVERFDRRDRKAPFMSLEKLKQSGNVETHTSEFLRLFVMVPDLSIARRVYMFIDGLYAHLHQLVKSTKPTTLQDSIERARDLQYSLQKAKATFQHKPSFPSNGKEEKAPPSKEISYKKTLDDDFQRDLRRRKLFFTFQEAWALGHRCATRKSQYVQVFSDDEEEEEDELRRCHRADTTGEEPTPSGDGNGYFYPIGGVLPSLRGVPKYLTLRFQDSILNERVSILIDSGATHNFIDSQLVQRREIPTDSFEGFSILVLVDRTMQCMYYVPSLSVTMGTYTLIDHFFVVDIPDTNVILGVQWLITLGKVTIYWEALQMEWVDKKSSKT